MVPPLHFSVCVKNNKIENLQWISGGRIGSSDTEEEDNDFWTVVKNQWTLP